MLNTKQALIGVSVVLALTLGASAADAALLRLGSGSSSSVSGNDVLGDTFASLLKTTTLRTTQDNVNLTFYYWGSESAYTNKLITDFGSHTEHDNVSPGGGPVAFPGWNSPLFSGVQAHAGKVDITFTGGGSGVTRFAFIDLNGAFSAKPTNQVVFARNDSGHDGDYDDYVGYAKATTVPIPAAAWLFGSALLGLGGIARRKSAETEA